MGSYIYAAGRTSPKRLPVAHDPDSEQYYTFRYRAPDWVGQSEYHQAASLDELGDIVAPLTSNGFYYEAVSSGVTGVSEPIWPTVADGLVADGTVSWKAFSDDTFLAKGDSISASVWTADDVDVILTDDAISGKDTYVKVTNVPAAATKFTLTNEIDVIRASGKTEKFHRSMTVKIKEK